MLKFYLVQKVLQSHLCNFVHRSTRSEGTSAKLSEFLTETYYFANEDERNNIHTFMLTMRREHLVPPEIVPNILKYLCPNRIQRRAELRKVVYEDLRQAHYAFCLQDESKKARLTWDAKRAAEEALSQMDGWLAHGVADRRLFVDFARWKVVGTLAKASRHMCELNLEMIHDDMNLRFGDLETDNASLNGVESRFTEALIALDTVLKQIIIKCGSLTRIVPRADGYPNTNYNVDNIDDLIDDDTTTGDTESSRSSVDIILPAIEVCNRIRSLNRVTTDQVRSLLKSAGGYHAVILECRKQSPDSWNACPAFL
jgi:hypothetical protein